jgi:hypothetical protein
MVSTYSGVSVILYLPYSSTTVPIYDGTRWHMVDFGAAGISQSLSDATKSPATAVASSVYDMFVWVDTGGAVRLSRGPAWTNTSTRALAVARTGPFYTNSSAITNGPAANLGTFVGTIATNTSALCDWIMGTMAVGGGAASLNVWNMFNRCDVLTTVRESTGTWTYAGSTYRPVNASNNNSVRAVWGWAEEPFDVRTTSLGQPGSATVFPTVGIGLDGTGGVQQNCIQSLSATQGTTGGFIGCSAFYTDVIPPGLHVLYALEVVPQAVTVTFYSVGGGGNNQGLQFRMRM